MRRPETGSVRPGNHEAGVYVTLPQQNERVDEQVQSLDGMDPADEQDDRCIGRASSHRVRGQVDPIRNDGHGIAQAGAADLREFTGSGRMQAIDARQKPLLGQPPHRLFLPARDPQGGRAQHAARGLYDTAAPPSLEEHGIQVGKQPEAMRVQDRAPFRLQLEGAVHIR